MAYAGIKRTLLETKAFASPGSVVISLKDVPPFRRVKYLMFRLAVSVTNAATGVSLTAVTLRRLFKNIRIGKQIYTTGTHLWVAGWHVRGLEPQVLADTTAGNNDVDQRIIEVVIPFEDQWHAQSPADTCQMSQMYRETPIQVDFENVSTLQATNTPTVAGTLYVYAVHEPLKPGRVPAVVEYGYLDWSGQRINIEGDRAYSHIHMFNEDGTAITSADVTGFTISVDGEQYDNTAVRPQDIAATFNWMQADGRAERAASSTAPVGGEGLTDHPGLAAAAAATVSMEYIPLFTMGSGYGIPGLLHATRNLTIDVQGSKTSFRIGWRAVVPKSQADRIALATLAGARNPGGPFRVHTSDGRGSQDPRLVALLPLDYDV